MKDGNGFAVAFVYFESEPGRRAAARLMTKDEARRIAARGCCDGRRIKQKPQPDGAEAKLGLGEMWAL